MALAPHALRIFAAGAMVSTLATSARAVDRFEVQVYDGTADDQGQFGLELHTNFVANGLPASPPLLADNHATHFTLEPSYGLLPWWELGGYFQSALRSDGTFDYAGIKLRSKFVTPPKWHPHVRLGVNFELSIVPEAYDADRIASEIRPIAAWENDDWLLAINPIIDIPLAGDGFTQGPHFEPAFMVLYKIGGVVSAGVEYYSGLGPIASIAPIGGQEHYVYEVANLLSVEHLELNVGIGEGLTDASNRVVVKTIVGYEF